MNQTPLGGLNFFKELNLLLDYSNKIYSEYLQSGKLFLYAKILYSINQRMSKLLLNNVHLCNEKVQKDAMELMLHLDVWSTIWVEEFDIQKPSLEDVFAFENKVTFPKESVERLLSSDVS